MILGVGIGEADPSTFLGAKEKPKRKRLIIDTHNVISMGMAADAFSKFYIGAEELRTGPDYAFNNRERPGTFALVIQRTVAGTAFFKDSAGRRLVGPGQAMLFTHTEESEYGYPPEATEPYRLRFVAFSPAGVRELFDRIRTDFGATVRMPEDSEATIIFEELMERFRKHQFRDRLQEAELIYRLLIAIYREQVQGTRMTDPIEFGYHYLGNQFRSPLNLKNVAERCGISREHFIREFTRRYRESPGVMLRRLRLEHARTLLASTELSVQDVALACGFTSSNTFCRAYRTKFKKSPGSKR